jgi:hypothetical protein
VNYLPRLALNLIPPAFCLLSSWNYKFESLAPDRTELLIQVTTCITTVMMSERRWVRTCLKKKKRLGRGDLQNAFER